MVLKGLHLTVWIGCLSGILLLKRPWGRPSFNSWLSFSTFYSLLGITAYFVTSADFLVNNSEGLFENDKRPFRRYVRAVAMLQLIVTSFLKRLAIIANAKKLGKLLGILDDYQERRKLNKNGKNTSVQLTSESVAINLALFLSVSSIFVRGTQFIQENASKPSWFNPLGIVGYSIFYYLFAILPLVMVTNIVFAIVLVVSANTVQAYCEFCSETFPKQSSVRKYDFEAWKPNPSKKIFSVLDASSRNNQVSPFNPLTPAKLTPSRQELFEQFEEIKELVKLTNEALSPLILWFVVSITIGSVTTASQVFVSGNEDPTLPTDIIYLILVLLYGILLQAGHKIGEKQRKAKMALQVEFMNMPWTPGKFEIEDLVQEILDWEWKLSASGFFTLDRRLASGIFSLILNYVVIFVQLNIALNELKSPSNSTSNASDSNPTINSSSLTTDLST